MKLTYSKKINNLKEDEMVVARILATPEGFCIECNEESDTIRVMKAFISMIECHDITEMLVGAKIEELEHASK